MKDLTKDTTEILFFEEWIVEIDKRSNKLTSVSFENRFQNAGRIYDIKDNIIKFEADEENNRLYLHTKTDKFYYINLDEEGCIFGDIFVGEDLLDTFAMFDINE